MASSGYLFTSDYTIALTNTSIRVTLEIMVVIHIGFEPTLPLPILQGKTLLDCEMIIIPDGTNAFDSE